MDFRDYEQDERMIAREKLPEDRDEKSLRPLTWDDYSGQKQVTDNLKIFIQAAMQRGEALDHCLLYGPPGLGKTTLAGIIANEMGVNLRITTGPAIEKAGDLAALLTNLQEREVLFIDEIHRLNRSVEEVLYPAMEDFVLDIMIGKGPSARSIRLDLPKFTLIGATTRAGMLSAPLRDRFGMVHRLELYKPDELKVILKRDADILGIGIDEDGLECLSRRSRGTPRIAIRLLKRLRDYAEVRGEGTINREIAEFGLEQLSIDNMGLDSTDRRIMTSIAEKFLGGPVGLDTLAACTGEDAGTIEDVYEPFLMQCGFIAKTPRGRVLAPAGWKHLGLTCPADIDRKLSGLGVSGTSASPDQMSIDDMMTDK